MENTSDLGAASQSPRSRTPERKPSRLLERGTGDGADTLSRALGWFSVGLGLAQLLAPAQAAKLAGAKPTDDTIHLMRALGAREFLSGVGILSGRHTEAFVRGRVAGDVIDLALLGKLMASDSADKTKATVATIAVAGVTALDVLAAYRGMD